MLKTALIVDDSKLARLTLKRLLEKYDLDVSEAEGVVDAERWISTNVLPDVVFMDVMMPEIDGFEGLARLRREPDTKNIPVIMYSGDVTEEARKKVRDHGATGYLPKPADAGRLDHLLKALNERLGGVRPSMAATGQAASVSPQARPVTSPQPAVSPVPPPVVQQPAPVQPSIPVAAVTSAQPATPTTTAPPQPAVTDELKRRLENLEYRVAAQAQDANSNSTFELNQDLERQRRDVSDLQQKVEKSEKTQKVSFVIGAVALLLAIVAAVIALAR